MFLVLYFHQPFSSGLDGPIILLKLAPFLSVDFIMLLAVLEEFRPRTATVASINCYCVAGNRYLG